MSFVDIIILLFIILGGFIGLKRGAVKEFVKAIGIVVITVLAFLFKNPLSVVFYENLPFFKFDGIFKGVTVLNIALYELIAFLLVFFVLMLVWKLVVLASSIIQKIINATVILGIPSKIIGFLIGLIEYYFITFIVLYVLSLPFFNFDFLNDSKIANSMLSETPIISNAIKERTSFIDEFASLKEKYESTNSASEFNYETLDLFLKYDIISVDSVKKLKEQNKLTMNGIDNLILKYDR